MTASKNKTSHFTSLEASLDIFDEWAEADIKPIDLSLFPPSVYPKFKIFKIKEDNNFYVEGVTVNLPFVFRYKYGLATLKVGLNPIEEPLYSAQVHFGPELANYLTMNSFKIVLSQLLSSLTKAPYTYKFLGQLVNLSGLLPEVKLKVSNEFQTFYAQGFTPEEAFRKISSPSNELAQLGVSLELQEELLKLQNVSPQPLNSDKRVFPESQPIFINE